MGKSLGVLVAAAALAGAVAPALAQPCDCGPAPYAPSYAYRGGDGLGRFQADYDAPPPVRRPYGADCPVAPGERVIRCDYVPFGDRGPGPYAPGVAAESEGFEGGVEAPAVYGGGGGGGGYGGAYGGGYAASGAAGRSYSASRAQAYVSVQGEYGNGHGGGWPPGQGGWGPGQGSGGGQGGWSGSGAWGPGQGARGGGMGGSVWSGGVRRRSARGCARGAAHRR